MTTSIIEYSRGEISSELSTGSGSAITPEEVVVTYEDALTRDEVLTALERIKAKVIEMDFPRV